MKESKQLLFAMCLLGVFMVPVPVQALMITNVTTGETLFYDDFENVNPVSQAAAVDSSGDYNPSATVGSYLWQEGDQTCGQVTNFSNGTSAGPGAAQGTKYLRICNTLGHEFQAELDSNATTPVNGDHINVTFKAYIPSADSTYAVFKFRESGLGGGLQRAGARTGANGVVEDLGGTATSLTYQYDVWQEWQFDYVIGQSTYTISVDGVSSGVLDNTLYGSSYAGPGGVEGLGFWVADASNKCIYIDAVPEPTTLGLLACGSIVSLFTRRRNRRN